MQKTNLALTDAQARSLYPQASPEIKQLLEASFTPEFFSGKITDRVKTMSDVFNAKQLDKDAFYKLCKSSGLTEDEIAYREVKLIVEVLNEGWAPNWDDEDERKWRPWFYLDGPSGFRFYGSNYGNSASHVGSRLCFKNEELCKYAATQFLEVYSRFFTK